jgi:ATP-dependent Lon protease
MATAMVSALTKRAARHDVAMTGEITLRGKVLPIGGLKEKLLAAHRFGIKNIIVSKENQKDLADVPEEVLVELNVECVETVDDVLKIALLGNSGSDAIDSSVPTIFSDDQRSGEAKLT